MILTIRPFVKDDWNSVSEIYRQGLLTCNATFGTEVPDYELWFEKFDPRFIWVAVIDLQVAGWAGLQPVSARQVYRGDGNNDIYRRQPHRAWNWSRIDETPCN